MQTNEKTFGVRNLLSSWRAKLHAAQAYNRVFLQVTDVKVHDLQLFDTTFMEISGGPGPLTSASFFWRTKLQVQQADHFFGVPHKFLGASSACTLYGMNPG